MTETADAIRQQLAAHGDARAKARDKAKREMAAIEQLAPKALGAGLTKIEVCRLAQITRPALDALLK